MTDRQNFSSWSEDEPRRASTGMKLVLFGALVPVFLVALLVGGFLLARGQADGTAVTAASDAQLDCSSARDAWRWACQKTGAATPSAAAAAVGDGPATTGSVEHKTGRSSSIKTATAEPAEPAKEPLKALPLAKAPVPPARPAEPDKIQQVASAAEPARAAPEKPVETKPASRPSSSAPERAAAPPEEPVPAVAPRLAVTPAVEEKAPVAALAPKPEESAKPERAARAPAAARGRERRTSVADDNDEKPARLARHRTKATESARRTVAAVREKAARQRVRAARLRARDEASDLGDDFRVSTTRTYVLPDGRRVMTYAQPRAEDVRELVAEHRARFGARRVASPYFGGQAYGGGWYGGSGEW
ncbi:MAG: hypothetical protein ACJ8DL_07355 [Microvirga sp.]